MARLCIKHETLLCQKKETDKHNVPGMSVIVTVHSYQFLPLLYKSEHLLTNAGIKPFFSHASGMTLGKAMSVCWLLGSPL